MQRGRHEHHPKVRVERQQVADLAAGSGEAEGGEEARASIAQHYLTCSQARQPPAQHRAHLAQPSRCMRPVSRQAIPAGKPLAANTQPPTHQDE